MEKYFEFEAVIQGGDERWPDTACVALPFSVEEEFGTKYFRLEKSIEMLISAIRTPS